MRPALLGILVGAAVLVTACAMTTSASGQARPAGPSAPRGVKIDIVARGVPLPTSFAFTPGGRILVGAADHDRGGARAGVYLVTARKTVRRILSVPTGAAITWSGGRLFIATSSHLDAYGRFDGNALSRGSTVLSGLPAWVNGVTGGPGGRVWLTIGADCDACSPTAPYAGTVTSLRPDGSDVRIVARGLRQPYGIAFPPRSASPLVSVVGQDDLGAAAPPDAVVRANPGSNFGFPECNWTDAKACAGFDAPVALLPPHTTPTGIAVIGGSAFVGTYGGREILRMPATGGKPSQFIAGFPDPVVAVGASRGRLYVGITSGTVYRITF